MEFVSFEDETAMYETVLFPEAYRAYRHLLFGDGPLFVRGRVEEDRGALAVTVLSLESVAARGECREGQDKDRGKAPYRGFSHRYG